MKDRLWLGVLIGVLAAALLAVGVMMWGFGGCPMCGAPPMRGNAAPPAAASQR